MDNQISLKNFETKIETNNIKDEILKAIQLVDLYTEEKNQNWVHFRWKIWEEICRFCPIKTKQPYWPFGKLVYYNSRFIFGELDIWLAHYWFSLNNGNLWIEEKYLKPFKYKTYNEYENKKSKKETSEVNLISDEKDEKETKEKLFIHSKEFTEAKYSYLSLEIKKYAKEKNGNKKRKQKRKPFTL